MLPTLAPGDEFVATDSRRAAVGEIVALPHPERSDFWLVKRLAGTTADGQAKVLSDNSEVTRADSRSFGEVPIDSLRPLVDRFDATTFAEALDLLIDEDERLRTVVDEFGPPEFWSRDPGFPTIVLLILEQQVSLESGAAVFRRLREACGVVEPASVLRIGEAGLHRVGATRQKASYIVGLASLILGGDISLDRIGALPPAVAREELIGIRGIGPWTAEAYLLSALGHTDQFPVGDRALQVGMAETLGLSQVPSGDDLELLAEPWRPIRSAAAQLIWHGYLRRRDRADLP